ncbi:MAG: Ig-like domain-containing protein, partial [Rhodothermia bacterium]
ELNAGFWPIVAGGTVGPVAEVIAVDDSAAAKQGESVLILVTLNDINPASGGLKVVSVTKPQSGVAIVEIDSTVRYTPDDGFWGLDTFNYVVTNDLGSSSQATVTVDVLPTGEAPRFTTRPITVAAVDVIYEYLVEAHSPGGEPVVFGDSLLPGWLALVQTSDTTANLSGTPSDSDLGDHEVIISAGNGAEKSVQMFTVSVVDQAPAVPELVAPDDAATLPTGDVTWIWRSSERAQSYRFQRARDSSFTDLTDNVIGIPDTTWLITVLDPGTYHWRVGADNPVGFSGFSVARSFIVGTIVATEAPDDVPERFELQQNYPNPFNPSTTVAYQTPISSHVRLVVYDVYGREVRVLVDDQKQPGSYTVTFEGSGLASGTYVYRIAVGDWVQSRTMILLK